VTVIEYSEKILILKCCEQKRQQQHQQFIGTELFFFVVKAGTLSRDDLEGLGREIGNRWINLGLRLGVEETMIKVINRVNKQLSEKGFQVLMYWERRKGPEATYLALCDALQHESVGRGDLAKKYCFG